MTAVEFLRGKGMIGSNQQNCPVSFDVQHIGREEDLVKLLEEFLAENLTGSAEVTKGPPPPVPPPPRTKKKPSSKK